MNRVFLALTAFLIFLVVVPTKASELTFGFASPSFSGVGQSSHYLTIENIEKTRKDTEEAKKVAAAKALVDETNATAIAKFKANLEARFYTALAKQIIDNVFGSDGLQQDSGTYTAENGEIITWATVTSGNSAGVTVTVNDTANGNGSVTFTLPYQDNE
jgi:hypothetical protein